MPNIKDKIQLALANFGRGDQNDLAEFLETAGHDFQTVAVAVAEILKPTIEAAAAAAAAAAIRQALQPQNSGADIGAAAGAAAIGAASDTFINSVQSGAADAIINNVQNQTGV